MRESGCAGIVGPYCLPIGTARCRTVVDSVLGRVMWVRVMDMDKGMDMDMDNGYGYGLIKRASGFIYVTAN